MIYKFLDKKFSVSSIKSMPNQQLGDELHKTINKKFKRRKYILHLKTIFGELILQNMQLISKYNKGVRFLLRVIDVFINMYGLFL